MSLAHVKFIKDNFEFRVFPDRVEVEGPGHTNTLSKNVTQLYYEFFKQLESEVMTGFRLPDEVYNTEIAGLDRTIQEMRDESARGPREGSDGCEGLSLPGDEGALTSVLQPHGEREELPSGGVDLGGEG